MTPTIMIALDFPTGQKALEFLDQFKEPVYVKVGMELYYSEGPSIIEEIKKRGHKIFLDLKLHDIPNTVKSAMKVLARLGVDVTNVHAAGGIKMMQAAKEGLEEGARERGQEEVPMLIAVTQLTSTDEEMMRSELRIDGKMEDVVVHYAENARKAGLDGVVCSAWESPMIHERVAADFKTITPGIRLAGDAKGDQSRVATPAKAKALGSDYLVIGRSITKAADPVAAYRRCMEEMENE
ncbi:MAG: orotidine-5'-phosphate decarboxylase [Eubacteriales bacterium]|nr:orotidine-5'-phosphate decarboxylase [Eubacteriales bacterium]